MDEELKKTLHKTALAITQLSIEAVQKANSGHPGMPMGCARIGAYLYGKVLNHNPKNPDWIGRDRFVLSAGHGSMWLYSALHISGFDLSLEDIKSFRQIGSKTPGHPEFGMTQGVEATTGPLGQGVGNAVGMALGMKMLAERFNRPGYDLFSSKVYCLAGDGCIMEGVSSEVSSLAGHLKLNNLVLLYDSNRICLDGPLQDCCSENTRERYKSYGWDVVEVDGWDFDQLDKVFSDLKNEQERPTLVICHTTIGKGSPKEGSSEVHGAPLGREVINQVEASLNLPQNEFYVPQSVRQFFEIKIEKQKELEIQWTELFEKWGRVYPELKEEFLKMQSKELSQDLEAKITNLSIEGVTAGRQSSQQVLQLLGSIFPGLIGGSADLSCSDLTALKGLGVIQKDNFLGRNIKFGVREFGMASIMNGLSTLKMFIPYCGTFFTFSDYMRNAVRLAALSGYQVIYQWTHDSVFIGEDGPTHQPVEHLASFRAMPGLQLIRPADANEVKMAWIAALNYQGPTGIVLSRQKLPSLEETANSFQEGLGKGAYRLIKEEGKKDVTLFATGSEVHLALEVASRLKKMGKKVEVISMPCWSLFDKQSNEYKKLLLGPDSGLKVSIEAASDLGWHKYIGEFGIAICIDRFGISAPEKQIAEELGFTPESILERVLSELK
jgi:transketolase